MLKDMLYALVPGLEVETYEDMMFCLGTESDEVSNLGAGNCQLQRPPFGMKHYSRSIRFGS